MKHLKTTILTWIMIIPLLLTVQAQENTSNVEVTRDSLKISSMRNIRMKSGNGGKIYYNDREIATREDLGRCATLVIAASNATEKSKAGADYVCTGVNDNEKIQEAVFLIAYLGVGGKIQLTEGDYNFSNGVWFQAQKDNQSLSIAIEGMGNSTVLHRRYSSVSGKFQGLFTFGLPVNSNITNQYVTEIRNMKYNGHMNEYVLPESSGIPQTFATSYTERADVLETTVCENIVCENIYNPSSVFIGMGCHFIASSLYLENAYPGWGIQTTKGYNQNGYVIFARIEKCKAPIIGLSAINKAFVTDNMAASIHLEGENIVCSGNMYNTLYNGSSNSAVSNNLQITP